MELRAKIEEWKKSVQVTPEMERQAAELERQWNEDPRWNYQGTKTTRPYSAIDVIIYRHVEPVESSVAKVTSQKLWKRLTTEPYLFTFGTASGAMTRAMVEAGARVIYVSGWVLAALRGYPDLSLYARSVMVHFVNDIVKNLQRHEDVMKLAGKDVSEGLTPLVVDMETGGGNPLVTYEYAAELIRVGAAAVHLEDQGELKKCGHMADILNTARQNQIAKLVATRFAADVAGVETVLIARTDSLRGVVMDSDIHEDDREHFVRHEFKVGERTPQGHKIMAKDGFLYTGERGWLTIEVEGKHYRLAESGFLRSALEGYFLMEGNLSTAIDRALAYAPYADLLWVETSSPDKEEALQFAQAIRAQYPGKLLAYNCSGNFNWTEFGDDFLKNFIKDWAAMGYKFQFITTAGYHLTTLPAFQLMKELLGSKGMLAYRDFQKPGLALGEAGYTPGTKPQVFAGSDYYGELLGIVTKGQSAVSAIAGARSTEVQFGQKPQRPAA